MTMHMISIAAVLLAAGSILAASTVAAGRETRVPVRIKRDKR